MRKIPIIAHDNGEPRAMGNRGFYASPTSGEAYRDQRLTTNFELWVEIFCVPTCFHVRIPKLCLSICPYPEKRYHHSFVNISPTLVIDTSMERSSLNTSPWKPENLNFYSNKFDICLLTKSWNHLSFFNISPTLVIDTSMERFSQVATVLHHGKPKIWFFFFKKVRNSNFDFWWRAEITLASSISVLH